MGLWRLLKYCLRFFRVDVRPGSALPVDSLQMESNLEMLVNTAMLSGREFTGANISEEDDGLLVRFSGTGEDGAEFSISGLFRERKTAVRSLDVPIETLDKYGRWSIKETAVSIENASGRRCWQLYMRLLM